MRLIDADALIEDLEYDVKLDEELLENSDLCGLERFNIQFDKDCKQNAISLLKDTPTAEPEPPWIPCSERLPEVYVDVIVSDTDGDVEIAKSTLSWGCDNHTRTTEWWYGDWKIDVTAWMPLPEPYKGGDTNE